MWLEGQKAQVSKFPSLPQVFQPGISLTGIGWVTCGHEQLFVGRCQLLVLAVLTLADGLNAECTYWLKGLKSQNCQKSLDERSGPKPLEPIEAEGT